MKKLYDKLDSGTTPATVLIPWFPTPSMISKLWATKEIYEIVVNAINVREKSGISRNDALQMLLDTGDERMVIVGASNFICCVLLLSDGITVYHGSSNCRCQSDRNHRYAT